MSDARWIIDDESASSPILVAPNSGKRISDCDAHWDGWEDEDYDALVQCVRDAGTLAEARELATRAQSIRRGHGPTEGYKADIGALLDLLTEEGDGT